MLINIAIVPLLSTVQASNKEIVLVLDPGHGGRSSGAVNYNVQEKDINLKIARYLRDYLNNYDGIKVLMTHDGLPNNVDLELYQRGMFARNNNADMVISLHMNASASDNQNGTEAYVTANNSLPKYYQESNKLAQKIVTNISKLGIANRGVRTRLCQDEGDKWRYSDGTKADYYGIIRYSMKGEGDGIGADIARGEGVPAIIVEHCFLRGWDEQFYNTEDKIKKLAEADGEAIVDYYNLYKKGVAAKTIINATMKNIDNITKNYINEIVNNESKIVDSDSNKIVDSETQEQEVIPDESQNKQISIDECKIIKNSIMQEAKGK